jgi:hypothetical protein
LDTCLRGQPVLYHLATQAPKTLEKPSELLAPRGPFKQVHFVQDHSGHVAEDVTDLLLAPTTKKAVERLGRREDYIRDVADRVPVITSSASE